LVLYLIRWWSLTVAAPVAPVVAVIQARAPVSVAPEAVALIGSGIGCPSIRGLQIQYLLLKAPVSANPLRRTPVASVSVACSSSSICCL